jgi:hypothetical protein
LIKALPDYTLVHTTVHNVLCVGGAVSTDRNLRISHSYINISWSMVALHLLGFWGIIIIVVNKSMSTLACACSTSWSCVV